MRRLGVVGRLQGLRLRGASGGGRGQLSTGAADGGDCHGAVIAIGRPYRGHRGCFAEPAVENFGGGRNFGVDCRNRRVPGRQRNRCFKWCGQIRRVAAAANRAAQGISLEKEKQSQSLATAAGETISPDYQRFFDAAKGGDWQTVTNLFESFKQRHPQYSHPHGHADASLRTSYWGPVLEICLAYDNVILCQPEYTQMAVDGILNSIPAGSIYFGGTDPGRGLPTAFSKSQVDADPFYTLTQKRIG